MLGGAEFEFHGHPRLVEIDLSEAYLWDLTAVAAVDRAVFRYRRQGAEVDVRGMNEASATLLDKVGLHDKSRLPLGVSH